MAGKKMGGAEKEKQIGRKGKRAIGKALLRSNSFSAPIPERDKTWRHRR